jgi:hypothetical protein
VHAQPQQKRPTPIVVPKPKWRGKTPSRWVEAINEDNSSFDIIYQARGGHSLRKNLPHYFPKANPNFHCMFDEKKDSDELMRNLKLDDSLSQNTQNRIRTFVKEFWDVFRMEGVKIPIRGYEMVIDTGDHQPIAVAKPHYGMHEALIMQNTIEQLLAMGFIVKDSISPWGFRITLAPKPHQENVTEIENYVWRFFTNSIRLNMITRPAEYPIPRCDDAVMFGFGQATHYILLDAYLGYHQIRLSPASAIKTAFYAPHGRKYMWVVMPFGLRNFPAVFIAMTHNLKELWTSECEKAGIIPSHDEGTTIIMDDTLLYAVSIDHAFIILRCVCLIAGKYHLTWKLIKAQWFPDSVEFVGVDMKGSGGNVPARSKHVLLHNWKAPSTARAYLSFVRSAIFYLKWMPWFELKVAPIQKIIKDYGLDERLIASPVTKKANEV